jgi:hypothetical protein
LQNTIFTKCEASSKSGVIQFSRSQAQEPSFAGDVFKGGWRKEVWNQAWPVRMDLFAVDNRLNPLESNDLAVA